MTQKLASLSIQLSANVAKFESDLGRASRLAKKESEKMRKQFNVAMKAIATSAVGAVAGISTVVKSTANAADSIAKMSKRIGASTEFLSEMRLATKLTGVEYKSFTTGIQRMTRRLAEAAATGKGEAVPALEALGVSIKSIQGLAPEKQFSILADAMEGVTDQGERVRIAMKLFDTEGVALLQTMEGGSEAINQYRQQAENLGLTISGDAARAAEHFNDQLTMMNERFRGIGEQIGFQLMPAVSEIISQFNSGEVADANEQWQGLQTTLASVYGGVLLVKTGFESVGKAVGVIAVRAVESLTIVANSFESFTKRLERGALIISELWSDDAYAKSQRLGGEISNLEAETNKLLETLVNGNVEKLLIDDIGKSFREALKQIEAVKKASTKTGKEQDKGFNKAFEETNKLLKENTKLSKEAAKEFDALGTDYDNIINSLLSPLESLKKEYNEQIEVIHEWQAANRDNEDILGEGNFAIMQLTESYEENKKAIENTLTPYDQLIESLNEEIKLLKMSTGSIHENEAIRLLMSQGIIKAGEDLKQYAEQIEEVTLKLEQMASQQGIFGNNVNSFGELLGNAFDTGDFFNELSKGFKSMTRDAENFAQGMASITDFASFAIDSFNSHSGQDDVGQALNTINDIAATGALGSIAQGISRVASFINELTGGRLFGTSYELESAQTNFNVNPLGGSGTSSQTNVRQRSLFRGREWQTIVEDLTGSAAQAIQRLFEQVSDIFNTAAVAVGSDLTEIISGAFQQNFDADGNLTSEFSTILGRTFNESFEEFSQRLIAENIIAVLDSVLPQVEREVTEMFDVGGNEFDIIIPVTTLQMVDEVSYLAEQFRGSASSLLDFANFALIAVTDIQAGNELLESLTDTTNLIQELGHANESLAETYARVKGSTELFESSLQIIGQSLELSREEFVIFSTEIAEAAGGLQEAGRLWQSYFETFYDSQELLEQQIESARQNSQELLGGLGIIGDQGFIDPAQFREIFESLLPTLSAEAVTQWLQAADALGLVIDLESQLTETRSELADLISGIEDAMQTDGLSDFQLEIRRINEQLEENINTAIRLGASERELGLIRAFATRQLQNAMQSLEQDIIALSNAIFGTAIDNQIIAIESQLTGLESQIALLEQQQTAAEAAAQAAVQAYNAQQQALEQIAGFVQSLVTSQFSILNPAEQLAAAQAAFDEAFEAAQAGDIDALNSLQGLANILLGLGQDNFASGQGYTDIFNYVLESLGSLGLGGGVASYTAPEVPQELQQLYDLQAQLLHDMAELQAQAEADNLLLRQEQLYQMLQELSAVSGESIEDLAERLGIPLDDLVSVLGDQLGLINSTLFDSPDSPLIGDPPSVGGEETIGTLNDTYINESNQTQELLSFIGTEISELKDELINIVAGNSA